MGVISVVPNNKNINVIYYTLNEFLLLEYVKYLWLETLLELPRLVVNIITGNEPNKTVNCEGKNRINLDIISYYMFTLLHNILFF